MSALIEAMKKQPDTITENGAFAYSSVGDSLENFFSVFGSSREDPTVAVDAFSELFEKTPELALAGLFYFRDIRGGQGVREAFRQSYRWLACNDTRYVSNTIPFVPEYGRWDDLYCLCDTPSWDDAVSYMKDQFYRDLRDMEAGRNISLLGKWLKSENASSKETKKLAVATRKEFGLSSKQYRKALSDLRRYIDVVERKMSSCNWEDIDYSRVPSQAMRIYSLSFERRDTNRFWDYLRDVRSGKSKINSSALYPYEIIRKLRFGDETATDEQWSALPDFAGFEKSIAIVDVSGSMFIPINGLPLDVSVSLGIYMAERMKGPFNGYFITFSSSPKLVELKGDTISEKYNNVISADWGMTTDIESAFALILDSAIEAKVSKEDMPKRVYVISDMQFDEATKKSPPMKVIQKRFSDAGYDMPELVFWNVAGKQAFPSRNESGILTISGFSPSILKFLIDGDLSDPVKFIMDVITSERYAKVLEAVS